MGCWISYVQGSVWSGNTERGSSSPTLICQLLCAVVFHSWLTFAASPPSTQASGLCKQASTASGGEGTGNEQEPCEQPAVSAPSQQGRVGQGALTQGGSGQAVSGQGGLRRGLGSGSESSSSNDWW